MDSLLGLTDWNSSLSIYPIYGGTNFGFTNGAEHPDYIGPIEYSDYYAVATSYDFDAPISEAGDPTQKFYTLMSVFAKYFPIPNGTIPAPSPKVSPFPS